MGAKMNDGTDGQLALLSPAPPPVPDWCDLRCCDVAELLADLAARGERVDLVVADPPWAYPQRLGGSGAEDHYACLSHADILDHLRAAHRLAAVGSRCLLWTTWAMLPSFTLAAGSTNGEATPGGWRWISGGSWCKVAEADDDGHRNGAPGIGYHLRSSESEPFLCLLGPSPHARSLLRGAALQEKHRGRGERHSEKPIAWQSECVAAWCPPGGLVLDLYAGLGSVARAVRRAGEGRRYVGAEIDPERHAGALALLAQKGAS